MIGRANLCRKPPMPILIQMLAKASSPLTDGIDRPEPVTATGETDESSMNLPSSTNEYYSPIDPIFLW
jgi:hypothetical protein